MPGRTRHLKQQQTLTGAIKLLKQPSYRNNKKTTQQVNNLRKTEKVRKMGKGRNPEHTEEATSRKGKEEKKGVPRPGQKRKERKDTRNSKDKNKYLFT